MRAHSHHIHSKTDTNALSNYITALNISCAQPEDTHARREFGLVCQKCIDDDANIFTSRCVGSRSKGVRSERRGRGGGCSLFIAHKIYSLYTNKHGSLGSALPSRRAISFFARLDMCWVWHKFSVYTLYFVALL